MTITKVRTLAGMVLGVLGMCLMLSWSGLARDATRPSADGPVSVDGEIVDLACYTQGRIGRTHPKCTKSCLMDGSPIGLLTAGGQLYLLIEDSAHRKAYQTAKQTPAEQVRVAGKAFNRGGVQTLLIGDLEVLKQDPGACTESAALSPSGSAGYCGESSPGDSHTMSQR